jgi:serine/threonine-protein kinase
MAEPTPVRRLGKYELIERIGVGGMAEVFLARMRGPMNFQKVVVVKTIHPSLASQEEFISMLLDEARVSALIKHPAVVDIYDLGCADGMYFIAMEYLDGQPLSAILSAGVAGNPLDPYCSARIIADAADGLHAAHELSSISGKALELVHRDVSPGNIIVTYDGRVKLVDFGVARARGRLTQSGMNQLKGKLGYMAPEQIAGRRIDRRSDIFSLGVVLWESLTLTRLFPSEHDSTGADEASRQIALLGLAPPSRYSSEVPPALDEVCARALAADPDQRFQTAEEMKLALVAVLDTADRRRDAQDLARYTRRIFAGRRRSRAQLLRRLGTDTGEFAALTGLEEGRPDNDPTPAASTVGGARARRRWGTAVLMLLAIVAGGIGAAAYLGERPPWQSEKPVRATAQRKVLQPVAADASAGEAGEAKVDPAAGRAEPPVEVASGEDEPDQASREPDEPRQPDTRPADGERPADKAAATEDVKPEKDAKALYAEGTDLFIKGRVAQAKRRFKEALKADRRHAPAYRGLGLVYQATGKKKQAIASFKRYLRLRPNASDAGSIRARVASLEP